MRLAVFFIFFALSAVATAEFLPERLDLVPLSNEEAARKLHVYGEPPCEETETVDGKVGRSASQVICLLKYVRREIKNVNNYGDIKDALSRGAVVVSMNIGSDGMLTDVKVVESTFKDERIDEIVVGIVRNYKFKSQEVKTASFGVELIFRGKL